MESMDAWEDAIYKKNQDQGFRHRYGIGQDWPHYDNEDYDNGIWQDDDGKCWTVYPGERQATCLDDEMNESVGRKTIRLTEGELRGLITKILNEEYINPEGSLDNPNAGDPFGDYRDEIVNDYNGDDRAAENDYSWGLNQGDYPSTLPGHRTNRNGVNRDIDDIHTIHNRAKEWSPKQLRSADRMKDKWIKGERDLDDIDDAFYGSSLNEAVSRAIRKYLK